MAKIPIHVEVQISSACSKSASEVEIRVADYLKQNIPVFRNGFIDLIDDAQLSACVDFVQVSDIKPVDATISFWQADLFIHPYRLLDSEPEKDYLEGEDSLPACEQWELPNKHLAGLWDSIVVEDAVKSRLLGYCGSSIAFANANVDPNLISWNRMAMLYGPPGTGKTTLCKALAQKMFIRHCTSHYSSGALLEINSHSLFSKWFSESGKLVMKLFDHIHEIADDKQTFVVVLIDEVESIVMARNARSNEPGDAVRVVNSVLTSLDALRRRPNVLILCTSNLVSGIDAAFKDRLDLQVYLGPPSLEARYTILLSCLAELMQRGLIQPPVDINPDVNFACMSYQQKVDGGFGVDSVEIHERVPMDEQGNGNGNGAGGAGAGAGASETTDGNGVGRDKAAGAGNGQSFRLPNLIAGHPEGAMVVAGGGGGGGGTGQAYPGSGPRLSSSSSAHVNGNGISPSFERRSVNLYTNNMDAIREVHLSAEELLFLVASMADDLSGRALRKLPLKAHAFYLQRPVSDTMDFLWAMQTCLEENASKREQGLEAT